jgi:hypothetical protein
MKTLPFDCSFDAPIEARVICGEQQVTVCSFPYGTSDGDIAIAKAAARRLCAQLNKIVLKRCSTGLRRNNGRRSH